MGRGRKENREGEKEEGKEKKWEEGREEMKGGIKREGVRQGN